MELIDGGLKLNDYCATHELPLADRIRLFQKVCAAVTYLHEANIVHRDLTPGNILVTKAGEPKIIDFGLAVFLKPVENAPSYANSELTPRRLGTPGYMSLQQARADAGTRLDDVFTLGRVLNVLVEESKNGSGEEQRIQSDLRRIIEKCCKEEPTERFRTVDELSQALNEILLETPSGVIHRSMAFLRRRRVSIAISLLGLVAISVGTSIYLEKKRRVEDVRAFKQRGTAQNLKMQAEIIDFGTKGLAATWSWILPPVTGRSGSFPEQVKFARKLVEAGDATAKAALGFTYIVCREGTLDIQKMLQKKTRAERYPKDEVEERRRSGRPMSQSEIDKRIDDEIYTENRILDKLLAVCSEYDVSEGIDWLEEIASVGQGGAAALLAEVFKEGTGGQKPDPVAALKWARKAIELGHPHGHYVLGELYFRGSAVPKNLELAFDQWEKATEFGNISSQLQMAKVFAAGHSVRRGVNKVKAYEFALLCAANNQGMITGTLDPTRTFHNPTRAEAAKIAALLEIELTSDQILRAQKKAKTWTSRPWTASTMKYGRAEHDAIRKAVLSRDPPTK